MKLLLFIVLLCFEVCDISMTKDNWNGVLEPYIAKDYDDIEYRYPYEINYEQKTISTHDTDEEMKKDKEIENLKKKIEKQENRHHIILYAKIILGVLAVVVVGGIAYCYKNCCKKNRSARTADPGETVPSLQSYYPSPQPNMHPPQSSPYPAEHIASAPEQASINASVPILYPPEHVPIASQQQPPYPQQPPSYPQQLAPNPQQYSYLQLQTSDPQEQPSYPQQQTPNLQQEPPHPQQQTPHPQLQPPHPQLQPPYPQQQTPYPQALPTYPHEPPPYPQQEPQLQPQENPNPRTSPQLAHSPPSENNEAVSPKR